MATIGGSNIVTNGLVLALDAANRRSYVSGSSVWNDISGNRNSGSLLNTPSFSSANGGIISFDGVDDFVNFSTTNLIVNTVNVWVYLKNTQGAPIIYSGTDTYNSGEWEWSIYIYSNTIYFRGNAGGFGAINYPASDYVNKWTNFTLIRNFNSKSYLYENGIYKNEANEASSINTNQLRIAKGGQYANMNLANTQIYNKALSPQEVLQNYEGLKSRYGL
jgi:hypothetical protein